MKQITTYQFTVKINGKFRTSPEYATEEERLVDVAKFLKHYPLRLTVNFFSNVRYISDNDAK